VSVLSRPPRLISLAIAAASLIGLAFTTVALAQRIGDFHDARGRERFYFIRTDRTEFGFAGRTVEIEQDLGPDGSGSLTVSYGSGPDAESLILPVAIPNAVPLPGLDRHMDWMQVFFFAKDPGGMTHAEWLSRVESGDIETRCVIAARYPNPGVSEDSRLNLDIAETDWGYGETLRDRWSFQFHELLPGGEIRSTTLRWPESGTSFMYRQAAAEREGLPPPERDPNELQEGTWQWDAALRIVPRPPAVTMENQALLSAGWTLPVASGLILTSMLGLAFGLAPERRQG